MVWRIGKTILAVLFFVFAWFQLNDEDASLHVNASEWEKWSWVSFYGLIALLFLWSLRYHVAPFIIAVVACFAIFHMVVTAPGVIENLTKNETPVITSEQMSPDKPEVELSREFFGAMIGLVALLVLHVSQRFNSRNPNLLE